MPHSFFIKFNRFPSVNLMLLIPEMMYVSFPECIDIYKLEERNEKKKQRKRLINFVILHIEEI